MKGCRMFGGGMVGSRKSYASGVRLGNAKSAKFLKRASGGRCEMGDVEGNASTPRLDKPGRKQYAAGGRISNLGKYAHGGKVHKGKAEGGEVDNSPPNPGEKSDAEQAKYLRSKASDKRWEGAKSLGQGAVNTILGATPPKFREVGKFGKTLKAGALITGPALLATGAGELGAASKADREAAKFGEGKKFGGRTKAKPFTKNDHDEDDD